MHIYNLLKQHTKWHEIVISSQFLRNSKTANMKLDQDQVYGGVLLLLLVNLTFPGLFVETAHCKVCKSNNFNGNDSSPENMALVLKSNVEGSYLELQKNSYINWDTGFKDCGHPMEGCKSLDDDSGEISLSSTSCLAYMSAPSYCRCDKECIKYGDCCVTVLKEIKKIPEEPYWRCNQLPKLLHNHAVRMISKCPSRYPNNLIKQLCEDSTCPSSIPNDESLCPLLDVPVLHSKSRDLYRNIYCSNCHSISNKELYEFHPQIFCSKSFESDEDWEVFKMRAVYHPKTKEWYDPVDSSVYCTVNIKEFKMHMLGKLVPNLRFCPSYAKEIEQEHCSMDLGEKERQKLHNLCHSYMQVVHVPMTKENATVRERLIFKNPHCAKCINPSIDVRRGSQCHRLRDRYYIDPCQVYPTENFDNSRATLPYRLEFDEDVYVGKCNDMEVLDLFRFKCVSIIHQDGQNQYHSDFNTTSVLLSIFVFLSILVFIIYKCVPLRKCYQCLSFQKVTRMPTMI